MYRDLHDRQTEISENKRRRRAAARRDREYFLRLANAGRPLTKKEISILCGVTRSAVWGVLQQAEAKIAEALAEDEQLATLWAERNE